MSERFLWEFKWDCGRQGDLEGLFVATEAEVQELMGQDVNFGEVLGKHSEVYGDIEEGEITKVDLDTKTVEKVTKILGDSTWSGYNPLDYVSYECSECGCSYRADEFNKEKNMCEYCVKEMEAE
ncbi:MAG TPA: hypothetical protein DDZ66_02290 [Firmicutes bacterium]|jgi:hypothetical protein|nr:hypothetical protein [Bacillota bacterium]